MQLFYYSDKPTVNTVQERTCLEKLGFRLGAASIHITLVNTFVWVTCKLHRFELVVDRTYHLVLEKLPVMYYTSITSNTLISFFSGTREQKRKEKRKAKGIE